MTWDDVKQTWDASWQSTWSAGLDLWEATIQAMPEDFREIVVEFQALLNEVRARLDRMKALVPNLPPEEQAGWNQALAAVEKQWAQFAAGLYSDARPSQEQAQVGWVHVLIVGGVAFGVSAVAWAVVAYDYVEVLDGQTRVMEQELQGRIELAKQGKVLPPSTLPAGGGPAPQPDDLLGSASRLMLGGVLLLGLFTALPTVLGMWRRSPS